MLKLHLNYTVVGMQAKSSTFPNHYFHLHIWHPPNLSSIVCACFLLVNKESCLRQNKHDTSNAQRFVCSMTTTVLCLQQGQPHGMLMIQIGILLSHSSLTKYDEFPSLLAVTKQIYCLADIDPCI